MAVTRERAAGRTPGWLVRLRALDERVMWSPDVPRPRVGPGAALALGLLGICVYLGWALVWGWPRALLTTLAVAGGLVAAGRFWFADLDAGPRHEAGPRAQAAPPYADRR